MVGEKENGRVFFQPFVFQQAHQCAHFLIQHRYLIQISRPVSTDDRIIRKIRRQLDLRGGGGIFRGPIIRAVRFMQIDLGVKRLVRFQIAPPGGVESLAIVKKIPVGLACSFESQLRRQGAHIGGVVARLSQPLGDQPYPGRPCKFLRAVAAVVLRSDACLIKTRHEGRARGGAHRPGGKAVAVETRLRRQTIDLGRTCPHHAVAAKVLASVLRDDP